MQRGRLTSTKKVVKKTDPVRVVKKTEHEVKASDTVREKRDSEGSLTASDAVPPVKTHIYLSNFYQLNGYSPESPIGGTRNF